MAARVLLSGRDVPTARRDRTLPSATLVVALACLAPVMARARASASEPGEPRALTWERVALDGADDEITALAADSGLRLAVGGERGAWRSGAGGNLARVLRRGPVTDLGFAPDGALLAGTQGGLYRVDVSGRVELRSPDIGAAARAVARIAALPDAVAVATGEGAYVSRDGLAWRRLDGALPSGAAKVVALRRGGDAVETGGPEAASRDVDARVALECWTVVRGELWRARLTDDAGVAHAERVRLPVASAAEAVALRFDVPGTDAVVLLPTRALVRPAPGARWEIRRLALPPGASARRLAAAAGRLWLATDRGLLEAPGLAGPWRRVAAAAGRAEVRALAAGGGRLWAATDAGLWRGGVAATRPPVADAVVPAPGPRREPGIEHVHAVAIAYLGLDPARFAALRRGLERRGWLPSVGLSGGYESDSAWGVDRDESFVSGDVRRLLDRDRSTGRDWDVSLVFEWELGDLAYHPEQIDVSREAREVIELRDDVLDEITQLYFERRRVLAQLASQVEPHGAEARQLRLRAAELAAGIDAWTGGWFSRALATFAP